MSRENKKHQAKVNERVSEEDIYLNLNPNLSKTIKSHQDNIKAQKQAKESLEKHKRIFEKD